MPHSFGKKLKNKINHESIVPFIGVQDVFAASIAANYFSGIFISGFSFSASHYGLPDIGFISWSDIVDFTQRVRTILPSHHIMVDIDDGYCDIEVAAHVVTKLEKIGASGVILEDQQRPRKCGHFGGKNILPLEQYIEKLEKVIRTRRDLFVIARTDSTDEKEIMTRVKAFAKCGADSVLVDGINDLAMIQKLKEITHLPITFSQMSGGKTPQVSLKQQHEAGVSLTMYSTPCLFAAQQAVDKTMQILKDNDGLLPSPSPDDGSIDLKSCTSLLQNNLLRRDDNDE